MRKIPGGNILGITEFQKIIVAVTAHHPVQPFVILGTMSLSVIGFFQTDLCANVVCEVTAVREGCV